MAENNTFKGSGFRDFLASANLNSHADYINPNVQGYTEYFDHLRVYNGRIRRSMTRELSALFPEKFKETVIATTGSDARLEKGPASLTEILVFSRNPAETSFIFDSLKSYTHQHGLVWFDNIEIKNLDKDRMHESIINPNTEQEIKLLSPNRVFDAEIICEDYYTLNAGKEKLVGELMSEEGKELHNRIKDKLRSHKKVTRRGSQIYKGQERVHFNFEAGIAIYNPNDGVYSFKQGPLRAVQFFLVSEMIKGLRRGIDKKRILELPTNTVDKINYLEVDGLASASHAEIRDLTDCYKFFLWLYHKSQYAYAIHGAKEIDFDQKEAKERCKSIDKLCSSPLIKV